MTIKTNNQPMTPTLTLQLQEDGAYTIIDDADGFKYLDMLPHAVEIFLNDFREEHQPN